MTRRQHELREGKAMRAMAEDVEARVSHLQSTLPPWNAARMTVGGHGRPVRIRGTDSTFASATDAARAFGVEGIRIQRAISSGWKCAGHRFEYA